MPLCSGRVGLASATGMWSDGGAGSIPHRVWPRLLACVVTVARDHSLTEPTEPLHVVPVARTT